MGDGERIRVTVNRYIQPDPIRTLIRSRKLGQRRREDHGIFQCSYILSIELALGARGSDTQQAETADGAHQER
jgi:hypothetical protein